MDPHPAEKDPELRLLGLAAGGFLVWMTTFVVSARTLDRHLESAAARGLLVALGAVGCLTGAWTLWRLIVTRDEYSRQVHLAALALAFPVSVAAGFTLDLMQRAGFILYVPLMWLWIGMLVIWWLCIIAATRYYR